MLFGLLSPLGTVHDIDTYGARSGDFSRQALVANQRALATAFSAATVGDSVLVREGKVYHLIGGLVAQKLNSVTVRFEGELVLDDNITAWPHDTKGEASEFLQLLDSHNVTLTGAFACPLSSVHSR